MNHQPSYIYIFPFRGSFKHNHDHFTKTLTTVTTYSEIKVHQLVNYCEILVLKAVSDWVRTEDTNRSSHSEVFCIKIALENFAEFKEKTYFGVSFVGVSSLLKKRPQHRCFPVNFAKFSRTPFYIEHLRWLLLYH